MRPHPCHGVSEWCGKALSSFDQSTNRQPDSKAQRSDRCTPRTAVRIQDVTVDDEGQWAKGLEIDREDEAIARDEAFDLRCSPLRSVSFPTESRVR